MTKQFVLFIALFACMAYVYSLTVLPDPDVPGGYLLYRDEVEAAEDSITSNPLYDLWSDALRTIPNAEVDSISPGSSSNPENVKRVERVFPKTEWDYLTQMATHEYTYIKFLKAIGKFPAFCGTYTDSRASESDAICKKSIVYAFAHYAQETGGHTPNHELEEWRQALVHVREMGYSEGDVAYAGECGANNWQNAKWPCYPNQGYFGRGAKQLSYHYNYGPFSEAMYNGNASVLLSEPAMVADTWLNLASSIWFFLTPQPPKPAMLHVIDRTWVPSQIEIDANIGYGFGTTINIINGGLECGPGTESNPQQANRVSYFISLCEHYNVPILPDESNTCHQQTPYGHMDMSSATDVAFINWEQSWAWVADHPEGCAFACQLVGYQTAYSALVEGDYENCVENHYGSHANWPHTRVIDRLGVSTTNTPSTTIRTTTTTVPHSTTTRPSTTSRTTTRPSTTTTRPSTTSRTTTRPNITTTRPSATTRTTTTSRPATSSTSPPHPDFIEWIPGETYVQNGDKVHYNGKCFVAKNNPNEWETPIESNFFWDEVNCSGETTTTTPHPSGSIVWVPGETHVNNGDKVIYQDKCFIAKNNPGVWETPFESNWFWDEVDCYPIIVWVPGETHVKNGDKVTYQDKCFIAKNNPGVWETPLVSNWYWDEVRC